MNNAELQRIRRNFDSAEKIGRFSSGSRLILEAAFYRALERQTNLPATSSFPEDLRRVGRVLTATYLIDDSISDLKHRNQVMTLYNEGKSMIAERGESAILFSRTVLLNGGELGGFVPAASAPALNWGGFKYFEVSPLRERVLESLAVTSYAHNELFNAYALADNVTYVFSAGNTDTSKIVTSEMLQEITNYKPNRGTGIQIIAGIPVGDPIRAQRALLQLGIPENWILNDPSAEGLKHMFIAFYDMARKNSSAIVGYPPGK